MGLKEELRDLTGRKKRFMLMRIAEVDTDTAKKLCHVPTGTYNTWTSDPHCRFVELYRRRDEFTKDYKQEAIQLLRRDNQLAAVMLEEQIITKMREELTTGEYVLIRTNLARDVYTKLIGDLDMSAPSTVLSWEQRMQNIFVTAPQEETHGAIVEAEGHYLEQPAESRVEAQSVQSSLEEIEESQD